jgi:diguanylate cyclase (GGDEF)-like protein
MKRLFSIKKTLYLILLSIGVSAILSFLLLETINLEKKIESEMLLISTEDIKSIVDNSVVSIKNILEKDSDYIKQIKDNTLLQKEIEKKLEILITPKAKYSYLLYKDSKGIFRFLADGANEDEKAFVNQKFDIESSKWLDIYKDKKPLIINHKYLQELSISYLSPILNNKNEVGLILVVDFSIKKVEEINKIISLIKNSIIAIIIMIIIFILILIVQSIKFFAMKKYAYIDNLTNVFNRNYLQKIEKSINLNEYVLSVLDIDYFKNLNDTYGHDIGDKILKELAALILLSTRDKFDIVIRYGGEEFLILSKIKINDQSSALRIIERIFKNIQEHKFYFNKNEYINLTVSIGVNLFPAKSKSFREAFKLADISLYNAKDAGRNNIKINGDSSSINKI